MKKTIAFIPVRQGSKSIPLKNFKLLAEKPLFHWTAEAVLGCEDIDQLVISTDYEPLTNSPLLGPFLSPKVKIFERSSDSATDTASTESAIFDYIEKDKPDFDYFVLIQATCPFITSEDLTKALQKIKQTKADSLLTLAKQKKFYWKLADDGLAKPLNYSPLSRPIRQQMDQQKDFQYYYWENGAFYITKKEALLSSKCRISGKITGYPFDAPMDIDDPADWIIAEKLLLERK